MPPCAALLAGSLKSACSLTGDRLLATNRSRRWRCGLGRKESTYGPAMPLRFKINVDIAGSCFQTRADKAVVAGRLSQALGWRGRRGDQTSPASIGLRYQQLICWSSRVTTSSRLPRGKKRGRSTSAYQGPVSDSVKSAPHIAALQRPQVRRSNSRGANSRSANPAFVLTCTHEGWLERRSLLEGALNAFHTASESARVIVNTAERLSTISAPLASAGEKRVQ